MYRPSAGACLWWRLSQLHLSFISSYLEFSSLLVLFNFTSTLCYLMSSIVSVRNVSSKKSPTSTNMMVLKKWLQILWYSSHWELGSVSPLLGSADCFDQLSTAKVTLHDSCRRLGHKKPCNLYLVLLECLLSMLWKARTYGEAPCVDILVISPVWVQSLVNPGQIPDTWVKKPLGSGFSRSSSPGS